MRIHRLCSLFRIAVVLEHVAKLTDRLEIVPTHQSAGQGEKRLMHARPSLVAEIESTKAMQPPQGAFDDPARASQTAAVEAAAFGQLTADPSPFEVVPDGAASHRPDLPARRQASA